MRRRLVLGVAGFLAAASPQPVASTPAWDPWTPASVAPVWGIRETTTGTTALFGLWAIRGYQTLLSPILGGRCQFEPSCSRYTFANIESHGFIVGTWLGADRISRCHGFAELGDYPAHHDGRLSDPAGD